MNDDGVFKVKVVLSSSAADMVLEKCMFVNGYTGKVYSSKNKMEDRRAMKLDKRGM